MATPKTIPVIIGVGDVVNRSPGLDSVMEPLQLIIKAVEVAIRDTGLSNEAAQRLRSSIDSIDLVRTWTWPYPDLPSLLAENLGAQPKHKHYSDHGGNQPAKLFDEASRRISSGAAKVALVAGGEALASLTACTKAGKRPPPGWSKVPESVESVFSPTMRALSQGLGSIHSIGAPIQVYPLYENAYRAARGQSIADNNKESAQLYAEFAKVAEKNKAAWNYGKPAETQDSIGTVTKRNRMICFPYPLLMNAFNTVDLAGACILVSLEFAEDLGVPRDKWIYPLGGAGTRDSYDFWERPNYYSSPALSESLNKALEVSHLEKNQIDLFDFYSCFPIVPKLACCHLGLNALESSKPITLLGGLTSFGGAGNNYSMHAITEMVRKLRKGEGRNGLVLANGGCLTYQHVICLSSEHCKDDSSYPEANPLPEYLERAYPPVEALADGEAIIETYTVEYNRDNTPFRGYILGRLKVNGHRFLANHMHDAALREIASTSVEPIGRTVFVTRDSRNSARNLFAFDNTAKL